RRGPPRLRGSAFGHRKAPRGGRLPNAGALSSHEDWESCARCSTHGEQNFRKPLAQPINRKTLSRDAFGSPDGVAAAALIGVSKKSPGRAGLKVDGVRHLKAPVSPSTPMHNAAHSFPEDGVTERPARKLDHSRTLPQGDGRAGPAFTRRAIGGE